MKKLSMKQKNWEEEEEGKRVKEEETETGKDLEAAWTEIEN